MKNTDGPYISVENLKEYFSKFDNFSEQYIFEKDLYNVWYVYPIPYKLNLEMYRLDWAMKQYPAQCMGATWYEISLYAIKYMLDGME